MTEQSNHSSETLPLELELQVDEICNRFEMAWQTGEQPIIEAFISDNEQIRQVVLEHLVHIDLERRLKIDENTRVEQYFKTFPQLIDPSAIACELIIAEFRVRQQSDSKCSIDEYSERFPQFADELAVRFQRLQQDATRTVRLNCPHCHNFINIVDERPDHELLCPSCGSSFHVDSTGDTFELQPEPTEIGKFKILEIAGQGAFGTVYKAKDTELNRVVAIKLPRRGSFQTQADENRFLREARNAAQLVHTGIVSVYDVGRTDDCPYIVSEYIEGKTLAEALKEHNFTPYESARLTLRLAESLNHAHQNGVIHRDIKPSNIILESKSKEDSKTDASPKSTYPNKPRLMDFGLSRQDGGEATMTMAGHILGTPAYMSPEQARGEANRADNRSDIYSLGVILFELLTGERPFQGNSLTLLDQVINDEPPRPQRLNKSIPKDLETICLKCLEKDPDKRYQTAWELIDDLQCFLNHKAISARPISHPERLWRWCKRQPVVASLLATVLLTLSIGLGFSIHYANKAEQQTNAKQKLLDEKKILLTDVQQQLKTVQRGNYNLQLKQIQAIWKTDPYQALKSLDDTKRCPPDLRDFTWQHLRKLLSQKPLNLIQAESQSDARSSINDIHTKEMKSIVFSPNGRWLAATDRSLQDKSYIFDTITGKLHKALEGHWMGVKDITFTPDSQLLVTCGGTIDSNPGGIKVWNVNSGELINIIGDKDHACDSIAISPDGKTLASGDYDGIHLWDLKTGKYISSLIKRSDIPEDDMTGRRETGRVNFLAFAKNGKTLVADQFKLQKRRGINTWNLENKKIINTITDHRSSDHQRVSVHSHLNLIAYIDQKGIIYIRDLSSNNVIRSINVNPLLTFAIALSPDGKFLASSHATTYDPGLLQEGFSEKSLSTIKLWDIGTGNLISSLIGNWHKIGCLAISPDGKQLAAGSGDTFDDGELNLWQIPKVSEIELPPQEPAKCSDVSPDNKFLAWGSTNGVISLWNLEKNRLHLKWNGHDTAISTLLFTPGNDSLVTSAGNELRVWDLESGSLKKTFKGHTNSIENIDISPDGNWIAFQPRGSALQLWNLVTGKEKIFSDQVLGFSRRNISTCQKISPDSRLLAIGTYPKKLHNPKTPRSGPLSSRILLLDIKSGEIVHSIKKIDQSVNALCFSRNGQLLYGGTGTKDNSGMITCWNVASGQLIDNSIKVPYEVIHLAISDDGKWIAMGFQYYLNIGDRLMFLNVEKDVLIAVDRLNTDINNIAFLKNSKQLMVQTNFGIELIQAPSGRRTKLIGATGHAGPVKSVSFTKNGTTLLSTGHDGTIREWDFTSNKTSAVFENVFEYMSCSDISGDNSRLVIISKYFFDVDQYEQAVLDLKSKKVLTTYRSALAVRGPIDIKLMGSGMPAPYPKYHSVRGPRDIKFLNDSKKFLASYGNGQLGIWKTSTNELIATLPIEETAWYIELEGDVRKSKNNHRKVSQFLDDKKKSDNPAEVKKYQNSFAPLPLILSDNIEPVSLSVSKDGRLVAAVHAYGAITVWNLKTKEILWEHRLMDLQNISFSPGGETLVTFSRTGRSASRVILNSWDAKTGKLLSTITSSKINDLTFSPNGKSLVTAHENGSVIIRDPISLVERFTINSHTSSVECVGFSPDSLKLASGDTKGNIKIISVVKLNDH